MHTQKVKHDMHLSETDILISENKRDAATIFLACMQQFYINSTTSIYITATIYGCTIVFFFKSLSDCLSQVNLLSDAPPPKHPTRSPRGDQLINSTGIPVTPALNLSSFSTKFEKN